jgi:hypothetical protein
VEQTIHLYQDVGDSENLDQLKKFLDMEKCEFSVDGIIELIVQVRGNLSHFLKKAPRKKGILLIKGSSEAWRIL